MGVTEVQDKVGAFLRGSVTDTVDLQRLLEAGGNADDHVVQERAGQTVQSAILLLVAGTRHMDDVAFDVHVDLGDNVHLEDAVGTLDGDVLALDLEINAGGQLDGSSTNSRHICTSLTRRTRGLRRRHALRAPSCRS